MTRIRSKAHKLIAIASAFLILSTHSVTATFAQNLPPVEEPKPINGIVPLLSDREYILSIAVLVFGFMIIGFEVFLLRNSTSETEGILRMIVVTLIVVSGLFVITAGLSSQQIAPVIGLYGAIIGYLLGKENKTK